MHCSGDFTVLTGFSNTSMIRVQDAQGTILWKGTANNTYLVFQQDAFSVIQQPPLFFFPLDISPSTDSLAISLAQADPQDISLERLITNVSTEVQNLEGYNTTEIVGTFAALDDFISVTSLATNGAMLLLQTNDTLTIDNTTQQFSSVGFARFTTLDVTDMRSSEGLNVQGDCSLVFLGDHFYNPQAKSSSRGTAFPFELLFLWIVALCVFLLLHVFIKPDTNEQRTNTMKRYAFALQFILLFLAILLFDNEVNSQFGISAFTALFTLGYSLITGVLILVELIIWVLGFVLLALPVQILVNSGLRFFGIGKEGKGIGRGIGFLSIWVFCGLYLLLIMNTIISLFHLNIVFPTG
jgi:hypothetical protein